MNDDKLNYTTINSRPAIDHICFDERKINITDLKFTIIKVNGEKFDYSFDFNRLVQLGIITPKEK